MVSCLVFVILGLEAVPHDRPIALALGALGFAIGIATQVAWLRADHPRLNWTLPRPHHFNAAGVYHGIFLTAMCAVTAYLWALAVVRYARCKDAHRRGSRNGVSLIVAAVAALGFLVLLQVDQWRAHHSSSASAATTGASIVGATALVLLSVLGAYVASRAKSRAARARHM